MRRRLFLAVAILATAVFGTTAAPALAHGTAHAKAASFAYDCNNFDAFASLTASSALVARGDDVIREPTLNVVTEALPDSAKGKAKKDWKTVTILVWATTRRPPAPISAGRTCRGSRSRSSTSTGSSSSGSRCTRPRHATRTGTTSASRRLTAGQAQRSRDAWLHFRA